MDMGNASDPFCIYSIYDLKKKQEVMIYIFNKSINPHQYNPTPPNTLPNLTINFTNNREKKMQKPEPVQQSLIITIQYGISKKTRN